MSYLGNYKSLHVGYSGQESIRSNGASGGVVSSLLIGALDKKIIDAAIVVGMDYSYPWRARVKTAKNRKEVLSSAGSKYTLIPVGDILEKADTEKGRLAVVGLPCHIKVIRNLQKKGKYRNIKFIVGLFCGYNMSAKATDFLIKKSGINKKEIEGLRYRGGKYPGGFLVKARNGKTKFFPKYYYDFVNLMFVPRGCLACKDYTNESADVSVGDAWGYDKSSLTIIRTNAGERLAKSKLIKLEDISEEKVLKMHWHNIMHKKIGDSYGIKFVMWFLRTFKYVLPFKLVGMIAKIRRSMLRK